MGRKKKKKNKKKKLMKGEWDRETPFSWLSVFIFFSSTLSSLGNKKLSVLQNLAVFFCADTLLGFVGDEA